MTPFDAYELSATDGLTPASDPGADNFAAQIGASFDLESIERNRWWLRERRTRDKRFAMLADISEAVYGNPETWKGDVSAVQPPAPPPGYTYDQYMEEFGDPEGQAIAKLFDDLAGAREADQGAFANFPETLEDLESRSSQAAIDELKQEHADAQGALDRSTAGAFGRMGGALIGAGASVLTDVETLPFLPFGAGAGSLARAVLIEGGIGFASEVAAMPAYARQAAALDLDDPDYVEQLAFATSISAAIPLVGRGLAEGINAVRGRAPISNRALAEEGAKADNLPEHRAAARLLSRIEATRESAPSGIDPETHMQAMDAAEAALLDDIEVAVRRDDPPLIEDQPPAPPAKKLPIGPAAQASTVEDFDLDLLSVDARAYQYKLDGDGFGVNQRLRGETVWDPTAAVGVIVHERADGRLFMADGHQRFALAKRLTDDGVEGVTLQGFRYREENGFSVEAVRVIAALRNLRQESGDPLSAAKIIRDYPEMTASLSRSRNFMLQADGLARLGEEPFQAVVNDVIPQNYGAVVGRLMPGDDDFQRGAIAALREIQPANVEQAEAVIREVRRLGLERRADDAQGSLFEGLDFGQTVIAERAKVLDAALKELRRDKTVFTRLSREGERIEGAGNVLNDAENQARAANATQALQRLFILADADGPVRDALDAAARDVRGGTRVSTAARRVVEAVTRAADSGFAGGPAGGADNSRAAAFPPPPVNLESARAPRATDLFSDPTNGRGARAQVDADLRELRAALDDDPEVSRITMPMDDGEQVTLGDLLQGLDDEAEFVESVKLCIPPSLQGAG